MFHQVLGSREEKERGEEVLCELGGKQNPHWILKRLRSPETSDQRSSVSIVSTT
jgi:hypothetical protein